MTAKKWVMGWAVFGLFIPLALTSAWELNGLWPERLAMWIWPSSIFLMALDSYEPAPLSSIFTVYGIAIAANILLYALAGVISWALYRAIKRRRPDANT